MLSSSRIRLSFALSLALVASGLGAACGAGNDGATTNGDASNGFTMSESTGTHGGTGSGGAGHATSSSSGFAIGTGTSAGGSSQGHVVSLEVKPAAPTLDVVAGSTATQAFQAIAHYADGSSKPVGAMWTADALGVGSIDGTGTFTANGALGGLVHVTATAGGQTGAATLTVVLHVVDNTAMVDAPTKMALEGATTPDAAIQWDYPYDGTVFPRGIGAPLLMWDGSGPSDVYLVHLTSSTCDLEAFVTMPAVAGQYPFDQAVWDQFTSSTTGPAELKVSRWDGTSATLMVDHHDTVAPGSMRGTIYYWAINTGRVMRIQPGATAPDDLFNGVNLVDPAKGACVSCHTAAANGSRVVLNAGHWDTSVDETSVSYDLVANATSYSVGEEFSGASPWALSALSADGKVVVENWAPLRGPIATQSGAFDAATGAQLPNTGLEALQPLMPAFSADDQLFAYVEPNTYDLHVMDWSESLQQASNDRMLVPGGSDPANVVIGFPTISPDHKWVLYQRSSTYGSLGNPADLYLASVDQPGVEIALDGLNGTNYPFPPPADRDVHLDYEPTFAPVASGGYFWVVFHSRRRWGNELTGAAFCNEGCGVKQLWVAAIDQAPVAGVDPSHPAFHLPGQDPTTLNMRGYWALNPCKADGAGCQTGTDCCGGYCAPSDGGAGTCQSNSGGGCSNDGDHCDTVADCCDMSEACINHVCSQTGPH